MDHHGRRRGAQPGEPWFGHPRQQHDINGASSGKAIGPAPFVEAKGVGVAGANATRLGQCYSADANAGTAVLDPRRSRARSTLRSRRQRSNRQVARGEGAGGIGMVLVNMSPDSLNADIHFVPTVHVDEPTSPSSIRMRRLRVRRRRSTSRRRCSTRLASDRGIFVAWPAGRGRRGPSRARCHCTGR